MPTITASFATAASGGTVGVAWNTPSNALTSNDTRTIAQMSLVGATNTEELRLTGADFSAIPDHATITGVVATIEGRLVGGGPIAWSTVRAFDGSNMQGDNQGDSTAVSGTESVVNKGSGAWGWWTVARLKNTSNGVAIMSTMSGVAGDAEIDQVRLEVTYALPQGGAAGWPWRSPWRNRKFTRL